jgi:hypothetical protein
MSIKIENDQIIIPMCSEEADAFLIAALRATRELAFSNMNETSERVLNTQTVGKHHLEDVATDLKVIQACDILLEYHGVGYAD